MHLSISGQFNREQYIFEGCRSPDSTGTLQINSAFDTLLVTPINLCDIPTESSMA